MRRLSALTCLLLWGAGCSPRPGDTWQGTVQREFGEPIPWTGHVLYDNPRWSGSLENAQFKAGGWIQDPSDGPLFAQAGIEIARSNVGTPDPLSVGDAIPILHLGQDRGDADWWAHASWIEQSADGEVAMRYVFNNTGGDVEGQLTFTDLGEDPEAGTKWWAADIDLNIDMVADDGDHPGVRELHYTLRWGPYTEDGS